MSMSSYFDAVCSYGIVDELVVLGWEGVEALLDDMVAIEILDQGDDVQVESHDERLDLPLSREVVDHLLNSPSSMHIERDTD